MKCFRVPVHMHVTNWGIVAFSLVAIFLNPWHAGNLGLLAVLLAFCVTFVLNGYWLANFNICVNENTVQINSWFRRCKVIDLQHISRCERSRRGLPSMSNDDLALFDEVGNRFLIRGQMEGGSAMVELIEELVDRKRRSEADG